MESSFSTKVEKVSGISQKLTVTVPASFLQKKYETQLANAQKKAKLKGFRPGHVPLPLVREYYGSEARSQVFQNAIDESYRAVLKEHQIKAVGQPKIEPQNVEAALEMNGKDLVYTATIEVMPEIQPKNYTGLSLTRDKTAVTDKDVEQEVNRFLDHHATLDVAPSKDKKLEKGDFADFSFKGGIVTENGVEEREGMSGQRVIEIGSNGLIAGFEDEMIGLKAGDKKTFRITFPKEYDEKSIAGKEAEFSVDIHEVKVKKLPDLTDDFVKENGYESVVDLKEKAREALVRGRKDASDQKLRSDLLQQIIDKNKFDVPEALIAAQLQASLQEIQQDLRQRGFNDQMIQEAIGAEFENIKKRADNQVRAGLLLDAIAKTEKIEVKEEDFENHFKEMAESTKMGYDKIKEFYTKNPSRKESFRFRLLEDLTIKHIISKSKVKEA